MRSRSTLAVTLAALVALAGCGGGDGDGDPTGPQLTAAELTARGWTSFEAGDLNAARGDFDAAIARDDTYAPAYVGQGWARLGLAATGSGMLDATTSFTAAIVAGDTGAEVLAGRAARISATEAPCSTMPSRRGRGPPAVAQLPVRAPHQLRPP